jgi:ABC-type sugar transport system ATPase subunit
MNRPRLEVRGIIKRFPGVIAVDRVDLVLAPGEIHALVGENGSGKSTLCMVISGAYRPDGGEILVDGKPMQFANPRDAMACGIAMTYQESNLVPELTVAENIALGQAPFWSTSRELARSVRAVLTRLGFPLDPDLHAGALSGAQMQMVEIAKALFARARLIVMDEPTAALSATETQALHRVIRALAAEGVSVIYISHALEEALTLADTTTVLRDGRMVGRGPSSGFTRDSLIKLMVGQNLELAERPTTVATAGAELLRAEGLTLAGRVSDASLALHAGEVVGLAGLVGSGRSELAAVLAGIERPTRGQVLLRGRPLRLGSPVAAARAGIGYLSENRKEDGLFLPLSVTRNITMGLLPYLGGRLGVISGRREAAAARDLGNRFAVSAPSLAASVRTLSGGNQQKVLLARLMSRDPQVLILDEPTKGVDVGAIAEIHRLIRLFAAAGNAALVISSYLPEIIALSDRVLVMREGRLQADLPAGEASADKIMSRFFR